MQSASQIRESITVTLVKTLPEDRIPWRKPWASVNGPRTATNFASNRPYSGVNTILDEEKVTDEEKVDVTV